VLVKDGTWWDLGACKGWDLVGSGALYFPAKGGAAQPALFRFLPRKVQSAAEAIAGQ